MRSNSLRNHRFTNKTKRTPQGCPFGTRVFAHGEDSRILRLTSELDALRLGNANPQLALCAATVFEIIGSLTKQKGHRRDVLFVLAAELGFEPRHTESESAVLPLHNSAKY